MLSPLILPTDPSELKEMASFWDGACFHKVDLSQGKGSYKEEIIDGQSIYFAAPHIDCYGHALLDGVLHFYSLLKHNNLLESRLNLIVEASSPEANLSFSRRVRRWLRQILSPQRSASANILQLLKSLFKIDKVIFLKTGEAKIFSHLLVHQWTPCHSDKRKYFSFYTAFPESFKYIHELRALGMHDNAVYQELSKENHILDQFVEFILKKYKIDRQMIKNRVLVTRRTFRRKFLNEEEFVGALRKQGYHVAVVEFEKMSLEEQIVQTIQAEYVIGTYGSNLVNCIFLKPEAKVVIIYSKYAKYFWSRRYCIIHSAFLSRRVKLIEYDKAEDDDRDQFTAFIEQPGYFYKEGNKIKLRDEKKNLEDIIKFPQPGMYELLNVNIHVDSDSLLELMTVRDRLRR